MWLSKVKETLGEAVQIDWQPFSLDQVNSKEGPEWKAWDQPNALVALRAGEAARRQGPQAFDTFLLALLRARHEDRRNLEDEETVIDAAKVAGLDVARFREDLADKALLEDIAKSHTRAAEELGVFGVPTFEFPNGATTFLKTYRPKDEEAVEMFDALWKVMSTWKYVGEMKRPQPPWPSGVFS